MKYFFLVLLTALMVISCTRNRYYRTKTGLRYQVHVTDTSKPMASMGTTAKVNYKQMVGDSIISTTYDRLPLYYLVMPKMSNYNPLEVFDYGVREGDSITVVQRIDSMMSKGIFKKKPDWMEMDNHWITHLKVEKVFNNDSLLQADKQLETDRATNLQTALGITRIKKYLDNNHIVAQDHENMFSQILQEGTGKELDRDRTVLLDFELKTLKGRTINSTIDTTFHNKGPKEITFGTHAFPEMIEKFLMEQKSGCTVKVYLPAVLLFGTHPKSKAISIDDDVSIFLKTVAD